MKPKDDNIVVVSYREAPSYKSDRQRKRDSSFMSHETLMKSSHAFFKPSTWYAVYLMPGGFKVSIPGLDDKVLRKSTKVGHLCVTGAEPGIYDIVEANEDFVICKKQSI